MLTWLKGNLQHQVQAILHLNQELLEQAILHLNQELLEHLDLHLHLAMVAEEEAPEEGEEEEEADEVLEEEEADEVLEEEEGGEVGVEDDVSAEEGRLRRLDLHFPVMILIPLNLVSVPRERAVPVPRERVPRERERQASQEGQFPNVQRVVWRAYAST